MTTAQLHERGRYLLRHARYKAVRVLSRLIGWVGRDVWTVGCIDDRYGDLYLAYVPEGSRIVRVTVMKDDAMLSDRGLVIGDYRFGGPFHHAGVHRRVRGA